MFLSRKIWPSSRDRALGLEGFTDVAPYLVLANGIVESPPRSFWLGAGPLQPVKTGMEKKVA